MSVLKWLGLVLTGASLAGCCTSGSMCYAPPPAGVPMAWDGSGTPPADPARPVKKRRPPKTEVILGPLNATDVHAAEAAPAVTSDPADAYAQQRANDAAAEQELKKRMVICSNCLTSGPTDITGSIGNGASQQRDH